MTLQNKRFDVLVDEEIDECSYKRLPYFLLGDEIFFSLKTWLMRFFTGRNATEKERFTITDILELS